jgi:mutator protein MutT
MSETRVDVALALIFHETRWLVQRRVSEDELDGLWEFPGGKINAGESAASAAEREAREETGLLVSAIETLPRIEHNYRHGGVRLHPVVCVPSNPEFVSPCSESLKWVDGEGLVKLEMAEANQPIQNRLMNWQDFAERKSKRSDF